MRFSGWDRTMRLFVKRRSKQLEIKRWKIPNSREKITRNFQRICSMTQGTSFVSTNVWTINHHRSTSALSRIVEDKIGVDKSLELDSETRILLIRVKYPLLNGGHRKFARYERVLRIRREEHGRTWHWIDASKHTRIQPCWIISGWTVSHVAVSAKGREGEKEKYFSQRGMRTRAPSSFRNSIPTK